MLEAQKGREQVEAKAAKIQEEKKKEMKQMLKEAAKSGLINTSRS
jgi:hypothetical protein